jgi:quinol monooxygenase YgiN
MAVLMTGHLPGATQETMNGLRPLLEKVRTAKGFVVHASGPVPGGWRVTEVWDSQADFEAWFEAHVKPAFPDGAPLPSITFDELSDVVTAQLLVRRASEARLPETPVDTR